MSTSTTSTITASGTSMADLSGAPAPAAVAAAIAEAGTALAGSGPLDERTALEVLSALSPLSASPLVRRSLFRLAVASGSPRVAAVVADLLIGTRDTWMARLLADAGQGAATGPAQRARLSAVAEGAARTPEPERSRRLLVLDVAADGTVSPARPGAGAGVAPEIAADDRLAASDPRWLAGLVALLEEGDAGIHRDVLLIRVAPGAQAAEVLSAMPLLPVAPVVLLPDAASAAALFTGTGAAVRDLAGPVIAVRTGGEDLHLVTIGGRSLLEVQDLSEHRAHGTAEAAAVAAASGLLDLVSSPLLNRRVAVLVDSLRLESRDLLPLFTDARAILRGLRYRDRRGPAKAAYHAMLGQLVSVGFFAEALPLLEEVPAASRDRVHRARLFRARFGTGRFRELVAGTDPAKVSDADRRSHHEALAAVRMLDSLDALVDQPAEDLDPVPGRVVSILHASVPEQSGGYAVRAHSILQEMTRHGLEVRAYTRPGFPEKGNDLAAGEIQEAAFEDIAYHRMGSAALRAQGEYVYMEEAVRHCIDVIRCERPSVVHLRSTYVSALPGLIAAKHFGLPVLYEVSGMWELVYEAANTGQMESRRARTVVLEDAVLGGADKVVTITEAMGSIIRGRASLRRDLDIVPNAVDTADFTEQPKSAELLAELGWDASVPVIGYIGSFVPYEGIDLIVRALGVLRDRGIPHRALLVGDGAAARSIRELAAELDLDPDAVRFTGRVPHEQVSRLYSLIDVCTYPRRWTPATEAVSPLKPFEAFASRKAVIVSEVPALREIAAEGERAAIVPCEDHRALADALERILTDPAATDDMRGRGQDWVRAERSWDVVGASFSAHIARTAALGRRPATPDRSGRTS